MAIEFNKIDKVILITSATTQVSIQELINNIRDYEDENVNLEVATIANAYGKQDLGGGALVGITLELINNWRVQFEARSGPDYIACKVYGGNIVAVNQYSNNPIKTSAYTQITIAQSTSPTLVEGSSASTSEITQSIWSSLMTSYVDSGTFGEKIKKIQSMLKWKL